MPRNNSKTAPLAVTKRPLDLSGVICTLPVEILHEIVIWATELPGRPCLQSLCLVSEQFRQLAQPLLLSYINIGCFTSNARKRPAQLKALSEGTCLASALARTIVIDYVGSFEKDPAKVLTPLEVTMLGHLAGAIRSFKNVKKVIWEIGEHEPSWMHDLIMKTLPDLPLESLVISIYERTFPSLQLSQLSHLRRFCIEWPGIYYNSADALFSELAKLIAQSPKLSHLELCLPRSSLQTLIQNLIAISPLSLEHLSVAWMRVLPEDILHLSRHLRNLKYLGLNKYINSSSLNSNNQPHDEIWERLQAQEIYLNNISTDCIDNFLVSYLDSFEGLGHLRLTTKNVATQPVRLLAAISAHHANSLVEFDLFAEHGRDEWAWPFDDQLKALLPSLYNLKYLGVTTHSLPDTASSGDENHIHALISFCEKSFPRLEILTLYFSPFRFWNSGAEVHFFKHRKVVHPSAYGSLSKQLHQAITTYQVVNTPPSTFRIMTEAQMFVRLHDSRTGAFSFILTE